MPRLPVVDAQYADERVAAVYQAIKQQLMPSVPALFSAFGAVPELLEGVWEDFRTVMGTGSLARPIKELLARHVSEVNACGYCRDLHDLFLHALGFDAEATPDLAWQVQGEHAAFDLAPLMAYAEQLTTAPARVTPEDYQELRSTGLNTQQLLEAVSVIGHANFFSRVANALDLAHGGTRTIAGVLPLIRRSAQVIAASRVRDELTPVAGDHPNTAYMKTQKEASRLGVDGGVFTAMAPLTGWLEAQEMLIVALRTVDGPPLEQRRALVDVVARLLGLPRSEAKPDLPKTLLDLASDVTLHPRFITDEQIGVLVEFCGSNEAVLGVITLVAWLNDILRMEQALSPRLSAAREA